MSPADTMQQLLTVDKNRWLQEAASIREYFESLGSTLPKEQKAQIDGLDERLSKV